MGTRTDLATVDVDHAAVLGLYETHRFCLRLSPDVSLLDAAGAPKTTLERDVLVVLVHEYFHYLHNLSTPSGFCAFQIFQQLLVALSHAMKDDGTCEPAGVPAELNDRVRESLAALAVLEGRKALPLHPSPAVGLGVVDVVLGVVEVRGVKVHQADVKWRIERRDGTREEVVLAAGAHFIEEGVAYLVEEFVQQGRVTFDESGATPTPQYPYKAYRVLVSALAPSASPLTAVHLGILALCTNRPGASLVHALRAYERLRQSGVSDDIACRTVRDSMSEIVKSIVQRICSTELGEIATMHLERGIVGDGHAHVLDDFRGLLTKRAGDLWFDVEWCREDGSVDLAVLSQLLLTTTPCDVIQEGFGLAEQPGRDALLTFKSGGVARDDGGVLPSAVHSGLRAMQAQFDFLLAHLSPTHGIVATRVPSPRRCPFFSSCTLEMRKTEPDVCRDEPWRRLTAKGETCWYGLAVAATLGTVRND